MKCALDMTGEERIARLDEGLVVLDRLLRNDLEPFSGRFTTYAQAQTEPGCLQSPRPPLIVAAHGPRDLKVAAMRADVWSSYGDLSRIDLDGLIALTKSRNAALNAACTEIGRDRATIGRSLLVPNSAVDPWGDSGPLTRLVEELRALRSMRLCSIGRDRTATTTSNARPRRARTSALTPAARLA